MYLYNILTSDDVVASIKDHLVELTKLIPEIKYMFHFDHKHPHHHLDVWEHTLYALSKSENNFDIRLVLLLHDIGKPFSYQEGEDGIRHFEGHPIKSAEMAIPILLRLGFAKDYIAKIYFYIANHDTPISNELIESNYDRALTLLKIQKCDAYAHHPDKLTKRIAYIDSIEAKLGFDTKTIKV